jgi:threonine dehydrogenase-like Zn-dependent dehydrogenase
MIYFSLIEYPSAVDLIALKLVNARGLIAHRFKWDEFEKALQTIENPAEKPSKVVITQ